VFEDGTVTYFTIVFVIVVGFGVSTGVRGVDATVDGVVGVVAVAVTVASLLSERPDRYAAAEPFEPDPLSILGIKEAA
jgi:small-conductance mechanosensitive channel